MDNQCGKMNRSARPNDRTMKIAANEQDQGFFDRSHGGRAVDGNAFGSRAGRGLDQRGLDRLDLRDPGAEPGMTVALARTSLVYNEDAGP